MSTNSKPMTPEELEKLRQDIERNPLAFFPPYTALRLLNLIAQLEAELAEAQLDSDLLKELNKSQAQGMAKLWGIVAPGYEGDLTIHEYCQKLVNELQAALKAQDQGEVERDAALALASMRERVTELASWISCENAFIICDQCGHQTQMDDLDYVKELREACKLAKDTTPEDWLAARDKRQRALGAVEELDSLVLNYNRTFEDECNLFDYIMTEYVKDRAEELRKEAGIA